MGRLSKKTNSKTLEKCGTLVKMWVLYSQWAKKQSSSYFVYYKWNCSHLNEYALFLHSSANNLMGQNGQNSDKSCQNVLCIAVINMSIEQHIFKKLKLGGSYLVPGISNVNICFYFISY